MKHRYSGVAGQTNIDGRLTKRPVIEVELSLGRHQRKFLALIDLGADQIMMPSAIAEAFEIDPAKCMRRAVMGVSMEPIKGFIEYLTFRIKDQEARFDAPVVFIETDIPVLLGREGFFDQYRIRFEQDHDTFEISPGHR